jgi:hypothetical protein
VRLAWPKRPKIVCSPSYVDIRSNNRFLTDIYTIFYPTATEYTFSSSAHGTLSKINLVLGHKTILNKYKS